MTDETTSMQADGVPIDDNKLIAERREKLQALKAQGQAFPNDFRRDALAGDLATTFAERTADWLDANSVTVCVAGRMMAKRDMGKSSFIRLQDA